MPAFLIGLATGRLATGRLAAGRAQRRLACALGIATLAMVALAASGSARAEDDEDETFEQGIIRGLLGGNSRPSIEYRERSPLVIPPNSDALPPPDASAAVNNPAWPQDPDKRKNRGPRRATAAIDSEREGARALRPDEMRRGTAAQPRDTRPALTQSDNEQARALRPSEYGDNRTIFNFFGSGKTAAAEAETFKGEPTRSRMTEPPPGYRTPSAAQPYREPKESAGSWFRAVNPFDRGTN